MSHVSVAFCPMSNLRNSPVACHSIFEAQCRMSNLKKGSVALSMLRVNGHNPVLSLFSPLLGITIMATLDKARQADQVPVCGYSVHNWC